jgi:hypothetical protein
MLGSRYVTPCLAAKLSNGLSWEQQMDMYRTPDLCKKGTVGYLVAPKLPFPGLAAPCGRQGGVFWVEMILL